MTHAILFFFVLFPSYPVFAAGAGAEDNYYGKSSSEAVLSFDYKVSFESKKTPTEKVMKQKIEDQVLHLFGPMAASDHPADRAYRI